MRSNHVGPEDIIVVEIKETVLSPPLLDHELVMSFFPWKPNAVGTSVEDLREVRILSTRQDFDSQTS